MSCSVFVHIKYSKELEKKIRNIKGTYIKNYNDFDAVAIPEELFSQHKKEDDAHRWVKGDEGMAYHFPVNKGKWEYCSHGFDIWLNFEGDIVFVVPCHWDTDHGEQTILDIEKWIREMLGDDIIYISGRVTF